MARTAVIAGTASAVAGSVHGRQEAKAQSAAEAQAYDQQQQTMQQQQYAADAAAAQGAAAAPAPPPAAVAPGEDPMITKLKQLADLHAQGILTDEEFSAQKAKILG